MAGVPYHLTSHPTPPDAGKIPVKRFTVIYAGKGKVSTKHASEKTPIRSCHALEEFRARFMFFFTVPEVHIK